MPNFRRIVDQAYQEILDRPADAGGLEYYNGQMNAGVTEAQLREALLRSPEYAERFPEGAPPPPPPPGGSGAIQTLTLNPSDKRCFLLNGKPWTIASHGNLVTAIPGHSWEDDLELQVSRGESYARLWHILAGHTVEWPWKKVGARWDLSQWNEAYWAVIRELLFEANGRGIVVEPHIFDRGCGGSQQDYKGYPWHPNNNVNGTISQLPLNGPGYPPFYEAPVNSNLYNLQAAYVKKWVDECRPFRGVILEIENEHRAGGGTGWARQWARYIKQLDPSRLVSYSSLEEDLEAAYGEPAIDIVCKHFGNDGNDPRNLHSYIFHHWSKGKAINIDEFANGLGNAALLKDMCKTIVTNGAHFHIEDSHPSADGPGAAANARALAKAANPPFCDVGPQGPAPPCPKEGKRGWSILYINRGGKRLFTGNAACEQASKNGLLRPGDNIVLDSTALVGTQEPVPEGCGTCVENPTLWSHTMGGKSQVDGPCGFQIWPQHTGSITARPKAGAGAAVTKTIKIGA